MIPRVMFASAAALALAAAAVLAQPEPPAVRVATRAEHLAAHPQPGVIAAACAPAPAAKPAAADI